MTDGDGKTARGSLLATSQRDRIAKWPVIVVVLLLLYEVALGISDWLFWTSFVVLPTTVIPIAAYGFWDLTTSWHLRQWRRVTSILVLPLFALWQWFAPVHFNIDFNYLGQRIRLSLEARAYGEALSRLPNDGKRYMVFDWSSWGGISTFLIFDESDRSALPRKQGGECSAQENNYGICGCFVVHFTGHYYFCSM